MIKDTLELSYCKALVNPEVSAISLLRVTANRDDN
jgi:hypothetical protein